MPYIKPEFRPQYDQVLKILPPIITKGNLEYIIFKLLKIFMKDKEYNYSNLHETVYAGIHASEEFKRVYLDQRENEAIIKNGDIKQW
jgi:hypothetical protein